MKKRYPQIQGFFAISSYTGEVSTVILSFPLNSHPLTRNPRYWPVVNEYMFSVKINIHHNGNSVLTVAINCIDFLISHHHPFGSVLGRAAQFL